jgi:hypothetical protein
MTALEVSETPDQPIQPAADERVEQTVEAHTLALII